MRNLRSFWHHLPVKLDRNHTMRSTRTHVLLRRWTALLPPPLQGSSSFRARTCNFAARMSLYPLATAQRRRQRRSKYEKNTSDIKDTSDIGDDNDGGARRVAGGMRPRKLSESAVYR